jgi:hypothetical protein
MRSGGLTRRQGQNLREASVEEDRKIVGWLPSCRRKRGLFTMLQMPPFTHLLGSIVTPDAEAVLNSCAEKSIIRRHLHRQFVRVHQVLSQESRAVA